MEEGGRLKFYLLVRFSLLAFNFICLPLLVAGWRVGGAGGRTWGIRGGGGGALPKSLIITSSFIIGIYFICLPSLKTGWSAEGAGGTRWGITCTGGAGTPKVLLISLFFVNIGI